LLVSNRTLKVCGLAGFGGSASADCFGSVLREQPASSTAPDAVSADRLVIVFACIVSGPASTGI
jgi:hypothetical protein